jgi:pyruvate-formate lyase
MEPTKTVGRRVTPDPKLLLLGSGWRARAKEILLRAETMKDAHARQEMREVAASYQRLAQQVEQLSGEADKA